MLKLHHTEYFPRDHVISSTKWMGRSLDWVDMCICSSLQQGSAPKHAVGGTWVAIAAMAPCLGKFETRLHPGPREARSTATQALRSPTCEVIRVRQTPAISFITAKSTSWTFVLHVHLKHGVVSFSEDEPLQDRLHFLKQDRILFYKFPGLRKTLYDSLWAGGILMFLRAVICQN